MKIKQETVINIRISAKKKKTKKKTLKNYQYQEARKIQKRLNYLEGTDVERPIIIERSKWFS